MPKNPHADFSPVLKGYSGQSPFKFWCQMALPLTYDDSLSYYELLNKVVSYLNNTISDVANVEDNVESLLTSFTQLQDYVNAYFDDIDVEQELKNILDEMAIDGTLDAIITPIIDDKIPTVVGSWLENNLEPTSPPIDSTLTIPNAAADAKATGDAVSNLKNALNLLESNTVTEYMHSIASGVNRTHKDITFSWNDLNTECTISGTASGEAFSNFLQYSDALPQGIVAGKDYKVVLSNNFPSGVVVRFGLMPTTLPDRLIDMPESQTLHIPSACTGITARLNVANGTVISAPVTLGIQILNGNTVPEIDEEIEEISDDLNTIPMRVLTTSEKNALTSLFDIPDSKYFTTNGSGLMSLDPSFPYSIPSGATIIIECLKYSSDHKSIHVYSADLQYDFYGWTSGSHPTSFTWVNVSLNQYSKKENIRVLIFGNSSTYSTFGYTPALLEEMFPDCEITVGILYNSGEGLAGHISAFQNDDEYAEFSLYQNGKWTNTQSSITSKNALDLLNWDIVVLQQSNDAMMDGTGLSDVDSLSDLICGYINYSIHIVFNMAMARGANSSSLVTRYPDISDPEARSDAAYNDISDYCQNVLESVYITDIIPCGTAVQNARHTTLKQYGDSTYKYLCNDNVGHLRNGIGVLCASYASAYGIAEIVKKMGKIYASPLNPTDAWLSTQNLYTKTLHGTCDGITNANKLIAQKCVIAAIKNPFEITTVE